MRSFTFSSMRTSYLIVASCARYLAWRRLDWWRTSSMLMTLIITTPKHDIKSLERWASPSSMNRASPIKKPCITQGFFVVDLSSITHESLIYKSNLRQPCRARCRQHLCDHVVFAFAIGTQMHLWVITFGNFISEAFLQFF